MYMIIKNVNCCVLLIIGILFLTNPVFAAINTIRPGDTVFIGEQGLDVTLAMEGDTQIGWWASAAVIGSTSPGDVVSVSNPLSFSISPGSKTGAWYHLNPSGNANGTAFIVAVPQLDIRIDDTTVNNEVTDKWVPTDDELQFRIETNLVSISQRGGGNPITIKVQSPDGGVYTSLVNNIGTPTSIVDYQVTISPKSTGPIWGTANRAIYLPGTYTIWAESYVNSQSPDVPLFSSRKVSVLNQDQNPLIVNKGYVTNPTTQISLVPSTKITSLITPVLTLKPSSPVTAVPTVLPMTTEMTVIPTIPLPTPTQTKSPGFEASIVMVAIILGLGLFFKK